jgi:acyl carrier protein phosphodiesterase
MEMNLLAHAILSGREPGTIVGGILADWIKGPLEDIASPLAEGIRRHRRVDAFTDAHPTARVSRRRLPQPWGRYAGILVDVAYDFCLIARWDEFGRGSLDEFVREVHEMVDAWMPSLPAPAADVARRMIAQQWLVAGRTWDRIGLTLERISRRLRRPVPLRDAEDDLRRLEPALLADFAAVFPDVRRHVEE